MGVLAVDRLEVAVREDRPLGVILLDPVAAWATWPIRFSCWFTD